MPGATVAAAVPIQRLDARRLLPRDPGPLNHWVWSLNHWFQPLNQRVRPLNHWLQPLNHPVSG